jgi:uncharacterized membrane protein YedE/YeeE
VKLLAVLISGALFGFGLALSRMVRPEVVLAFLRFEDFGLLLVLGGAMLTTFAFYRLAPRLAARPWFGERFGAHAASLDARTLGGAALFGIGWGLSGVCPGPAIAGLGIGNWPVVWTLAGLLLGALIEGLVSARRA